MDADLDAAIEAAIVRGIKRSSVNRAEKIRWYEVTRLAMRNGAEFAALASFAGRDTGILWAEGQTECRLCGHESHSVVPVDEKAGLEDDVLTRLECSNCGNMTAEMKWR